MNPRSRNISKRQEQVLLFMWEFFQENDQLPPAHTIKENFGLLSDNGPYEMCEALCRKGYLARNMVNKFKFTQKARDAFVQCPVSGWGVLTELERRRIAERASPMAALQ